MITQNPHLFSLFSMTYCSSVGRHHRFPLRMHAHTQNTSHTHTHTHKDTHVHTPTHDPALDSCPSFFTIASSNVTSTRRRMCSCSRFPRHIAIQPSNIIHHQPPTPFSHARTHPPLSSIAKAHAKARTQTDPAHGPRKRLGKFSSA